MERWKRRNEDFVNEVRRLVEERKTNTEIASLLGTSRYTVAQIRIQFRLPQAELGAPKLALPTKQIAEEYSDKTLLELGVDFETSASTIRNRLKSINTKLRKSGPRKSK
jgi:hypothetical protein